MPPIPAPTPSPVSGATWLATSGNTQTSGAVVLQAEYTQWLTFSGTDTGSVYGTSLHIVITAHNSCKFVNGAFSTSGFYQPQKFQVAPRGYDRFGGSYGSVSGGTSGVGDYVFGPQGTIITTQPYIRRSAKVATDVEYSLTQVGTNYAVTTDYASGAEPTLLIQYGD